MITNSTKGVLLTIALSWTSLSPSRAAAPPGLFSATGDVINSPLPLSPILEDVQQALIINKRKTYTLEGWINRKRSVVIDPMKLLRSFLRLIVVQCAQIQRQEIVNRIPMRLGAAWYLCVYWKLKVLHQLCWWVLHASSRTVSFTEGSTKFCIYVVLRSIAWIHFTLRL